MKIPEIDIDQLDLAIGEAATVVDVREPDEYFEARIPGAKLVPMATVPDRLGELHSGGLVHVVCATGARSARVVQFLMANDIEAVNVAGGTKAWIESGRRYESGETR